MKKPRLLTRVAAFLYQPFLWRDLCGRGFSRDNHRRKLAAEAPPTVERWLAPIPVRHVPTGPKPPTTVSSDIAFFGPLRPLTTSDNANPSYLKRVRLLRSAACFLLRMSFHVCLESHCAAVGLEPEPGCLR